MVDTIAKPPDRPAVADIQPVQEQYIVPADQVINVDSSGVESSKGTVAVRVRAPARSCHYSKAECAGEC